MKISGEKHWNYGKHTPRSKGADSPLYGRKHTKATKDKMSKMRVGKLFPNRKRPPEGTGEKISKALKGKEHSAEHNRKVSDAKKNYKFTQEHRDNILQARLECGDCSSREHVILNGEPCKECYNCKQVYNLNFFTKNSRNWDGLCIECKSCSNVRARIHARLRKERELTLSNAVLYS